MGLVEGVADLDDEREGLVERQGALLQAIGEALALQIFHDEEPHGGPSKLGP
jgi:hypothetical protein